MKPTFANIAKRGVFIAVALIALALISYFLIQGQIRGSKTVLAFAGVIALAPVVIYAAMRRPLVFPFSFYVLFIPFDQLLGLSRFGTLTRLFALLAGAALVFWLVRTKHLEPPPKSLYKWLVLFGWMLLTVFWALDPNLAVTRIGTILQLVLLYGAICLMPVTIDDLKAVLWASVVGGTIGAAYGAYYFHQNLSNIMARLFLSNGRDVIDPNHFAAALILPITIVTVLALTSRSILTKLLLVAADLVLFGGIYESGSRGSLVAVAMVFAYLFWASRQRLQIGFLAAVAVIASFFSPTSIWTRFENALSSGGSGRTEIWHVGFAAFKHSWLVGSGLENFVLAFDREYLRVFMIHPQGWSRASHSLIVEVAVELGLIGLLLMLSAWLSQYTILNGIRKDSRLYTYRMIAQGSVVGLFTAAMFLDVMYTKYAWLTFMVGAMTYAVWRTEQRLKMIRESRPSHATYVFLSEPEPQPVPVRTGQRAP